MLTEIFCCKIIGKLLVRTWHVAISVTLCGGRGSLWPDLLHSPQSQVTIYLHGITNAHRAVKCWQKPCLLSEKLTNLVNNLESVFAPSSTTKFAGDIISCDKSQSCEHLLPVTPSNHLQSLWGGINMVFWKEATGHQAYIYPVYMLSRSQSWSRQGLIAQQCPP